MRRALKLFFILMRSRSPGGEDQHVTPAKCAASGMTPGIMVTLVRGIESCLRRVCDPSTRRFREGGLARRRAVRLSRYPGFISWIRTGFATRLGRERTHRGEHLRARGRSIMHTRAVLQFARWLGFTGFRIGFDSTRQNGMELDKLGTPFLLRLLALSLAK